MPTNKPFFPNLRPVKKVITPQGVVLTRKECMCGNEFMGTATQTRCEKMPCEESKTEMMFPTLTRHGTLYVMWSCGSSRAPFIELARAAEISELDFGWWRAHIKIDWRPKGRNEIEFQARLSH